MLAVASACDRKGNYAGEVGGWAAGLDGVLEPLRRELARYCLRPPNVALSLLGEAAVATGALRLALDHVEEQLFAVEGTVTGRR